jgi:hypothetical protein
MNLFHMMLFMGKFPFKSIKFLNANAPIQPIENIHNPICINCVHFLENEPDVYGHISDSINGRCKKYGIKSLVTGEIDYEYALFCRKDASKCGKNGNEFIPIPPHKRVSK